MQGKQTFSDNELICIYKFKIVVKYVSPRQFKKDPGRVHVELAYWVFLSLSDNGHMKILS